MALILGGFCRILGAQDTQLALSSETTVSGGTAILTLSLTASTAVAGLQWTFTYSPTQITDLLVTAGPAALAAGKSISCSGSAGIHTCLAAGMNTNPLASGVVATVHVTVASFTGFAPIRLFNAVGVSPEAEAVLLPSEDPPVFRKEQPLKRH
jgi:hypothetical protein